MIVIDEGNSIFLTFFDQDKEELSFRASINPEQLQTEKIVLQGDMVYTNLYHFPLPYLQKFIHENKD